MARQKRNTATQIAGATQIASRKATTPWYMNPKSRKRSAKRAGGGLLTLALIGGLVYLVYRSQSSV